MMKKLRPLLIALVFLGTILGVLYTQGLLRMRPRGVFMVPIGLEGMGRVDFGLSGSFDKVPLDERIHGMPASLADYALTSNLVAGIKSRPLALDVPNPPESLVMLLRGLPPVARAMLEKKLVGIYLAGNLGADAFSNYVYRGEKDAEPVGGFTVLNVSSFQRERVGKGPVEYYTPNEWYTAREAQVFKSDGKIRLEAEIVDPSKNWTANVMDYSLLHELGHILAIGAKMHPSWNVGKWRPDENARDYPFFALSWVVTRGKGEEQLVALNEKDSFPTRARISFSGEPNIEAREMKATYDGLEKTGFPTLLAATNPFEDFAESFANYVHTMVLKRPYVIRVYDKGRKIKTYESCWTSPRCESRRALIEAFLR